MQINFAKRARRRRDPAGGTRHQLDGRRRKRDNVILHYCATVWIHCRRVVAVGPAFDIHWVDTNARTSLPCRAGNHSPLTVSKQLLAAKGQMRCEMLETAPGRGWIMKCHRRLGACDGRRLTVGTEGCL